MVAVVLRFRCAWDISFRADEDSSLARIVLVELSIWNNASSSFADFFMLSSLVTYLLLLFFLCCLRAA